MVSNGNDHKSRRAILKTVGGAGLATMPLSTVSASTDDTVEIVTGARRGEPTTTRTVPQEWYNNVMAAREAQSQLLSNIESDNALRTEVAGARKSKPNTETFPLSVRRTSAKETVGGLHKRKLEVPADERRQVRKRLPERIGEIPIDVVERPSADQVHLDDHGGGDTCRTEVVDCIQGGDRISTYYVNGGGDCGDTWGHLTITAGVTQNDETHVMTSAHGFTHSDEPTCNVDISGMPAYQGDMCSGNEDPNLIGHVQDYSHGLDFAIVDTDDYDYSVSSGVVDKRLDIDGYVTESGLDYMESNSEDCYKFGAKTCDDSGIVTGIMEEYSRCGEVNTWVEMTTQAAGGDSGAPHYREINRWRDYLQLIGPHVRHTVTTRSGIVHDKSYCPAAFQIYDEYGISFDMIGC